MAKYEANEDKEKDEKALTTAQYKERVMDKNKEMSLY